MNDEKRLEWKRKFEVWFSNHVEEHKIRVTKSNPNAVAIGCFIHTQDVYDPDAERRKVA